MNIELSPEQARAIAALVAEELEELADDPAPDIAAGESAIYRSRVRHRRALFEDIEAKIRAAKLKIVPPRADTAHG